MSKGVKMTMIGLTPDMDDGAKLRSAAKGQRFLYLWDRYPRAVHDHGALPVILPVTTDLSLIRQMAARMDGILLTGGGFDVPPEYYGEKPRRGLGVLKPDRSFFERALIREAAKLDKPVLGICGGMQIMAVTFGGTLCQDIKIELPHALEHQQKTRRTRPAHAVTIEPGNILHRIMAAKKTSLPLKLRVNSTHHQAVKSLGQGATLCGISPDGVIEAVAIEGRRFMVGVQWHPELLYPSHPEQDRIFQAFIREARRGAAPQLPR
jgi:putative glutamine amidotransferase